MSRSPEISASLVPAERGNGVLPTTIVPDSAIPLEIPRSPIAPASGSGHGRGQGLERPLPERLKEMKPDVLVMHPGPID